MEDHKIMNELDQNTPVPSDTKVHTYLVLGVVLIVLAGTLVYLAWEKQEMPETLQAPEDESAGISAVWNGSEDLVTMAVPSTTLDISNCVPEPDVLSVVRGNTLLIRNKGEREVFMYLSGTVIAVDVNGETELPINEDALIGIYGYACSNDGGVTIQDIAGAIIVTNEDGAVEEEATVEEDVTIEAEE